MKPILLENLIFACKGEFRGPGHLLQESIADIVIDSRKVQHGSLFFAIQGESQDGHQYIPAAVESGAICIVSHQDLGDTNFPYILVDSTSQALLDMAKYYRDSFPNLKVVTITGSVGKTSTKEMIASVLSQKYKVHKTLGNFNNQWGLPLSIFNIEEGDEISVLELGVNHFGEMRILSKTASPDVCVMTNIGVAHLEFFKTREGILEEKRQMLMDVKDGGHIILNGDDDLLSTISPVNGIKPLFFGSNSQNDVYSCNVESIGLRGSTCDIHLPGGKSFECHIQVPGSHMVLNALAGASVGFCLGLTTDEIRRGILDYSSIEGRNNLLETKDFIILDDCYNANPVSMKAALDVLSLAIGRKVAILGDMGELGPEEIALHKELGEYAAQKHINLVVAIGPLAKYIAEGASDKQPHTKALWFDTKEKFINNMKNLLETGDNVLVKASHGMDLPVVVEALMNYVSH